MNFKESMKAIGKQLLLLGIYFYASLVLTVIFYFFLTSSNLIYKNISYILVDLIMLTCFVFIFRKKIVPNFYDFKKNGKKYIKETYKYYLIGLLVMLASNLVISFFLGMPVNEETNREILGELPIYSIMTIVLFAPITEELLTRVALKDAFKNPYIYCLLSGLIFGSLHVLNVISTGDISQLLFIIPYGSLGFALAKIYSKTDNVWSNIFFHAFHNFICLILIIIGG